MAERGRPSNAEVAARKRELSRQQLAYVMWVSTPEGLRSPASKKEFAAVIGVDTSTLWRWEKDPRILDAVRFVVLQNAGNPERVGQILDMLHDKAMVEKDRDSAKIWLSATGVMNQFGRTNSVLEALDADPSGEGFSDFSDEQLEAMISAQQAAEQERDAVRRAKQVLK